MKKNQLLAPYTTFKIGGPADWFCETKNEQEVVKTIKFAKEKKLAFFILGNGSNLLVSDDGFRGVVIRMENEEVQINNEKILAKAGINLNKLANIAQENSLSGIEFMVGIPGTLGGVVFGNAGAWQQNIGDKVERVKILDKDNQFLVSVQVDDGPAVIAGVEAGTKVKAGNAQTYKVMTTLPNIQPRRILVEVAPP